MLKKSHWKHSERFQVNAPAIIDSFKRFGGLGFIDYLHRIRIGSALSLLASTNMSISDVAAEVGFDSYRSFTRVFKKSRGLKPSEYRETIRTTTIL